MPRRAHAPHLSDTQQLWAGGSRTRPNKSPDLVDCDLRRASDDWGRARLYASARGRRRATWALAARPAPGQAIRFHFGAQAARQGRRRHTHALRVWRAPRPPGKPGDCGAPSTGTFTANFVCTANVEQDAGGEELYARRHCANLAQGAGRCVCRADAIGSIKSDATWAYDRHAIRLIRGGRRRGTLYVPLDGVHRSSPTERPAHQRASATPLLFIDGLLQQRRSARRRSYAPLLCRHPSPRRAARSRLREGGDQRDADDEARKRQRHPRNRVAVCPIMFCRTKRLKPTGGGPPRSRPAAR